MDAKESFKWIEAVWKKRKFLKKVIKNLWKNKIFQIILVIILLLWIAFFVIKISIIAIYGLSTSQLKIPTEFNPSENNQEILQQNILDSIYKTVSHARKTTKRKDVLTLKIPINVFQKKQSVQLTFGFEDAAERQRAMSPPSQ